MAQFLKQSTAATIALGPFVDATDGVTAETALTIAQADIRLSKNGAAFAQTNNATGATHMENGHYSVPLDTTDTATLGRLKVAVNESGALPVWVEFMVVPANVYDGLVAGTDNLQVDTVQIGGTTQTANDVGADVDAILVDTAEIGVAGAGLTEAGGTGDHLTAVPWNAAWDAEVQSEVADALDAAIPVTPTADSINERLKTMDDADLPGDVAAVKSDTAAILTDTAEIGVAGAGLTEAGGTGDHLTALATAAAATAIETDTQDIQTRLPAALVSGRMSSDMVALSGDTVAADRLEAMMDGVFIVQVNGAATTTSIPIDGFTSTRNDQFNGRLITILDGSGEQTDITDYVHATQTLTVTALSAAPSDNTFIAIH